MLKQVLRLFRRSKSAHAEPTAAIAAAAHPTSVASPAADDGFCLPFEIRPMQPGDAAVLRKLFKQSIEQIGAKHYDAEAIAAWSASADQDDFIPGLEQGLTLVATLHGEHAGFAQLHPASHIEMLYLSPDASGLGIASLLYQYLEDEARMAGCRTLTTASSLTAQRFFESVGFQVSKEEVVKRGKTAIKRLRMQKILVAD
ncbi:GNAT family N-acetyltransferase [Alcanivorax sp. 1008]|uniref:GNAT family N-acetyltransferase n=1 Tax=Alcanivorax sp. 1008 TaxID=2816853 RepID=UPI001D2492BE|nr:GNAT family N-acetyltransferase [Alcanivorax sp. 1008]MCC1495426.1 GNAT family N-acetyltransferase [Alcanivorax sp. 1008]